VAGVWVLEFNFTPFCDAKETVTDRTGICSTKGFMLYALATCRDE